MFNGIFLTSGNIGLTVTGGYVASTMELGTVPMGTSDGTATGEWGQKVIVVGASAAAVVGSSNFAVTHVTALANGTSNLAARTGRRGVSIRCLTASTEAIFYGPTTGVTATSGAKLAAGESQPLDTASAVFVMSLGGAGLVEFVETY